MFIIVNCFWIKDQRKRNCINQFYLKRMQKFGYDINKFIDNIYISKDKSEGYSDSSGPNFWKKKNSSVWIEIILKKMI